MYNRFIQWKYIIYGVSNLLHLLGPIGEDRQLHKKKTTSGVHGVGVSTACGALSGGSLFSSTACRACRSMEGFVIRGGCPIPPGCCWLHETQLISGQPVKLGFPHPAWQYRPGRSPFFVSDEGIAAAVLRQAGGCGMNIWQWICHENSSNVGGGREQAFTEQQ